MKREIKISCLIVSVFFAMSLSLSCAQKRTAGGHGKLEKFIAQEIMRHMEEEYKSYEGSIIAEVEALNVDSKEFSPLIVWRYKQGVLIDAASRVFQEAFGPNRSKWPAYTFIFVVRRKTIDTAEVDLYTYYDRGVVASSRGGNSQKWFLSKQPGRWRIVKKEQGMLWD